MDEYIKRTDLEDWLCRICDDVETDSGYVMSRVDEIPVAKVREDIPAEWKYDSDNLPICNNCDEVALQRLHLSVDKFVLDCRFELSRYCPNCGARMTSQREDGNGT